MDAAVLLALDRSGMQGVYLFGVAVLSVGVAWVVRWGVQSLRQARALSRPAGPADLRRRVGRPVAVQGRPECDGSVVWERREHQTWRSSQNRGSWRTARVEDIAPALAVDLGEGTPLPVVNRPTEVHGSRVTAGPLDPKRHTTRVAMERGPTRTRTERLPRTDRLTVLGRLVDADGELRLEPDPALGLVYSLADASTQGGREWTKGIVGGVVLPVGWVLAVAGAYAYFFV